MSTEPSEPVLITPVKLYSMVDASDAGESINNALQKVTVEVTFKKFFIIFSWQIKDSINTFHEQEGGVLDKGESA